jgi:peptidoglycan/xylan/chitin deacetylase (PgdA/CDA1 family)
VSRDPLELLLRPAWPARVTCRSDGDRRSWLAAGDWRIFARAADHCEPAGEPIATFTRADGAPLTAYRDGASGEVVVPFSPADAYEAYVSEAWREESTNLRLSERSLRAFYRVKRAIPRRLQLAARRRLVARQGVPAFPSWPLDVSVGRLVRFYAACTLQAAGKSEGTFAWFWPGVHHAAVILTHDVESDEGLRRALELADLEEEHGFRSSFNLGAWYERLDPGVLRELTERGFEIGMHGLTHDRQLFASRGAFEERVPRLRELASRLGAVGFRSPATHRVYEWLGELPVEYDCTIPNSDPYEPVPGGCCSLWPFFIGAVVELPYTLPQDHTLLTLLGHRSPSVWLEQSAAIEREHGLIQCVSHPDPGYLADRDKRAVYAEFLSGLAERPHLWRALPREVAAWWRERSSADVRVTRSGVARLDGTATVVFAPPS